MNDAPLNIAPKEALEMHLFDHLAELRKRLIYAAIAVGAGTIVGYMYSKPVFALLAAPYYTAFPPGSLIGTGPAEAFLIRLKVALFAGIILASPILFAQLWLFIAPGLYANEKRLVIPFLAISSLLFLVGISMCYVWMLPLAFEFFRSQYEVVGIASQIRMSEQISLVTTAILGFGVVFELPMIAYMLGRVGLINHRDLIAWGRYAVVLIFIVSAIFTPPDAMSQMLMAGPLLLLYGISIVLLKFTARDRHSAVMAEK